MKNYTAYFLIFLGLGILVVLIYLVSPFSHQTQTFSPYALLESSWQNYKKRFISPQGRVIDYSKGDITTSEGQSYALLQAVWTDDKPTFDLVWNWTRINMQHKKDHLFGWIWGKRPNGTYGFMPGGGNNSASDADTDIALALVFASRRWNDSVYLNYARPIISDLWTISVDQVNGKYYLTAGNWAKGNTVDIINPSYLAPYAWRIFAQIDPGHDWKGLIGPAYELLQSGSNENFDKTKSVGLPPDWVAMDKKTGALHATNIPGLTTDFSFDALRIPWRIALDYQWNKDPRALSYLQSLHFLSDYYSKNGKLVDGYTHDGTPISNIENPAMYAGTLPYFQLTNPALAKQIYQTKIISLYSNDSNSFNNNLPYYEENWLWFGTAFYNHRLIPF